LSTLSGPVGHPIWPLSGTPSGRRQVRKKLKIKKNFFFLVVAAGWKRGQKEEGFFGLVPLVTHPSSIPLLGGLTPKFLSLSFHSL
jgi:hypothetical protein